MIEILNYPHPILRFKTQHLKRVDNTIHQYATQMIRVMKEENGIGLSANQVGLPFSMFVIQWQSRDMCFINPAIKPYGKMKTKEEGCLSFTDVFVGIERRSRCRFTAWDLNGDDIDEEVGGDLCRVLQHEMDHLNGVLFIDRISDIRRKSRPVAPHLAGMKRAWKQYPPNFDIDTFNELLYDYCGVARAEPV